MNQPVAISSSRNNVERLERHYTVQEIAESLKVSTETVRRYFRDEPGVLHLKTGKRGKRGYETLRIPQSAYERVARRMAS